MRFAIAIPQVYGDGEFDPAAFGTYLARVEELGFDSAWAQEHVLGPAPVLGSIETMTYAAARSRPLRLGCAGRARDRINHALERLYGRRSPGSARTPGRTLSAGLGRARRRMLRYADRSHRCRAACCCADDEQVPGAVGALCGRS